MPPLNNNIATVSVNVVNNASKSILQGITQGLSQGQKYANTKPINISVNTKGLASSLRGLNNLPLGKFSKDANNFEASISAATARVVAFSATAGGLFAVGKALTDLVRTAIDVEQKFKEIQVLTSSTTESFKQFEKGVFAASRATSSSFEDASIAAQEFSRQGLGLEKTLSRTVDALTLSKLSGLSLGKSVESLTAIFNTFQDQVSGTAEIVDKLAKVDASFAVSSGGIAEGLSRVGSTATEAGVSLDKTIGLITALVQRTGRAGGEIGNSFNSIFTRLQRPETLKVLDGIGVATKNLAGDLRPADEILQDLALTFDKLSGQQQKYVASQIGGTYQINKTFSILKDLASQYSITGQAAEVSATAQGDAIGRIAELNKTTSSLLQQTATNFTELSSAISKVTFDKFLKNILSVTTASGGFIEGITKSLSNIGTDQEDLGSKIGETILKGIANILSGPGLVIIGKVLGSLIRKVVVDVTKIGASLLGLNRELTTQLSLQKQIDDAIIRGGQAYTVRLQQARTLAQQEAIILELLKAQQAAAVFVNPLAQNLYKRGVRPGASIPSVPNRASGFSPVRKELSAIKNSPDYAGNRNARPQILSNFSMGGKIQDVIINSAEKVVPTRSISSGYAGPDKFSILNPKQQRGFGLAQGFLPFSTEDVSRIRTKGEANEILSAMRSYFGSDFPDKRYAKASAREAKSILARYVSKAINNNVISNKGRNIGRQELSYDFSNVASILSPQSSPSAAQAGAARFGQPLKNQSPPKTYLENRIDKQVAAERKIANRELLKNEQQRRKILKGFAKIEIDTASKQYKAAQEQSKYTKIRIISEKKEALRLATEKRENLYALTDSFLTSSRIKKINEEERRRAIRQSIPPPLPSTKKRGFLGFGGNSNNRNSIGNSGGGNLGKLGKFLNSPAGYLGAGLLLPAIGAGIESFNGNNKGSRMASSVFNGASVGLTAGLLTAGPYGALAGAVIGGGAGAISSVANEPKILAQENIDKRLKVSEQKGQDIESAQNVLALESRLEDLIKGGASREIIKSTQKEILDSTNRISDSSLRQGISFNSSSPFNKNLEQGQASIRDYSNQKTKTDIQDFAQGVSEIRKAEKRASEIYAPLLKYGTIPSLFSEGVTRLIGGKSQNLEGLFGGGALDKTKAPGIAQALFERGILKDGQKAPANLSKSIQNEFSVSYQDASKIIKLLQDLYKDNKEGNKNLDKRISEGVAAAGESNRISLELSKVLADADLKSFTRDLTQETAFAKRSSNLSLNSPFSSELTKSLDELSLQFDQQKSNLENQKADTVFGGAKTITDAVQGIFSSKNLELSSIRNELNAVLNSKDSESLNKNIDDLITQSGLTDTTELQRTKVDIVNQLSKVDASIKNLGERAAIDRNQAISEDRQRKSLSSFGGSEAFSQGNIFSQNFASNLGANRQRDLFNRSIPGLRTTLNNGTINNRRSILTENIGRSQNDAFREAETLFGKDAARDIVNPRNIYEGQKAFRRNKLSDFSSNLFDQSGLNNSKLNPNLALSVSNLKKNGNLSPQTLLDTISGRNFSRTEDKNSQNTLIKQLKAIIQEELRNPDAIADQVRASTGASYKDLGINRTTYEEAMAQVQKSYDTIAPSASMQGEAVKDNPLVKAADGINQNTESINQSLNLIYQTIENLQSAIKESKNNNSVGNTANVTISATSNDTATNDLIVRLQAEIGRWGTIVTQIADKVKVPIVPTTSQ